MPKYTTPEAWWRAALTGDEPEFPLRALRSLWRALPASPRCKFCNAPYHGWGAFLMKALGKGPSRISPKLCAQCLHYASLHLGGAEVEVTLLFADVRGSTSLAEKMSAAEYGQLMNRFFTVGTGVLVASDAWSDRLIGDQVMGIYVPGFAGADHAHKAVMAAQQILRLTGHGDPGGPWAPVGVGIHTGVAFVGAVGASGQASDITALGDSVNIAARLSAHAATGEVLITAATHQAAQLPAEGWASRNLELKGKSETVVTRVWQISVGQ